MKNVLIIEDNQDLTVVLNEILELNGFIVVTAIDGYQAIQKTQLQKPDIIICDIDMPIMNGWETLKYFRSIPEYRFIPFIFLTAKTGNEDIRHSMNLGANDYLTKPFDHNDLINTMSQQLNNHQAQHDAFTNEAEELIDKAKKDLMKEFEESTSDLEDSLKSAKHIQSFILPTDEEMNNQFQEHFNFFLPQNSVSGDFYWVKEFKGIKYVAVADCTGHGIPAAMISMVCHQILNSTIELYELQSPKDILCKANELVNAFMRAHRNEVVHYGMDISIVSIDEKNHRLSYAGASSSLIYTSKANHSLQLSSSEIDPLRNYKDYSQYKIKGDRYCIGNTDPNFMITEKSFNYAKNDTIYLYSDGYSDQFGGDFDKKFKSSNFENLILSIQNESFSEQAKIIEKTFLSWRGDLPSLDDVTVLGIRL